MGAMDEMNVSYDVVVLGGGAAGLNGALMLARSRRSVLVIDAGSPRNAPAEGVHGLLGHDGIPPAELVERGRAEVRRYGGQVVTGEVVAAARDDGGFRLTLADGGSVRARRLLVATGLVDQLPDVPGLQERWGRDVVHCPYCHGWEVRDRAIAVLATGPNSVHQALLFSQLSSDVVFLRHRSPEPSAEDAALLAARGVRVVEGVVTDVLVEDDRLTGVRLADGTVIPCGAIAVATLMKARTDALADLGLKAVPHPSGAGDHVPADPSGQTDVPGVWAAGNVTDLTAQVGASAAAGATAGARINYDLILEDAERQRSTLK
jgi:thioredoxin reductase